MTKKSEERKDIQSEDIKTENKDVFKIREDHYTAISKMWEDSYLNQYMPWLGSKGEVFEKAVELSKEATPQKYQEFFEEWVKTCQNTCGNFYEIPTVESSKEAFENFFESAPPVSPFNEIFEPVKNAAKVYADTFTSISAIG
jgi:hypothetical protein